MYGFKRFFPRYLSRLGGCAVLCGLLLLPWKLLAQECSEPKTQMEMNRCANLEYQKADKKLNEVYQAARKEVATWDHDSPDNAAGIPQALLKTQRIWIQFRDAHCETEGLKYYGGSIAPLIVSSCKTRKTQERTIELRKLLSEH